MPDMTWMLLRRVVRILLDYIEHQLMGEPDSNLAAGRIRDQIMHLRKDYSL